MSPKRGSYRVDLTGQKFGQLLVLGYSHYDKRVNFWKCQCECGAIKSVRGASLSNGRSTCCGNYFCKFKYHPERAPLTYGISKKGIYRLTFEDACNREILKQYKNGAKNRNLSFDLDLEIFSKLLQQPCHYCNTVGYNKYYNRTRKKIFLYNGIDRLNNDLGYTLENTVPCCGRCNIGKSDLTEKEFLDWITKIYKFRIFMGNEIE